MPNRNDLCYCGNNKKYKNCCLAKDRQAIEDKKKEIINYVSSNKINTVKEILEANFQTHKVIDITNILTIHSYKQLQIKYFNQKIIMIAERTNNNEKVFEKRMIEQNDDLILLYNGNYRLMKCAMILSYIESLKTLLNSDPMKAKLQK
jgi:uncharacterized protein YecA (UPF0149 family)